MLLWQTCPGFWQILNETWKRLKVNKSLKTKIKKSYPDHASQKLIVLVVTIKRDIPRTVQPLESLLNEKPKNVVLMVNFVVDPSLRHMQKCDHNQKEYTKLMSHILTQNKDVF